MNEWLDGGMEGWRDGGIKERKDQTAYPFCKILLPK
jgi:hypothetical protein